MFIKLTAIGEGGKTIPVLINVDDITSFVVRALNPEMTDVVKKDRITITVTESFDVIVSALELLHRVIFPWVEKKTDV